MMIKKAYTAVVCWCILMLSGCAKQVNYTDIIMNDFKSLLIAQDMRLQLYEGALDAVNEYIDSPAPESLSKAQSVCSDTITQLLELEEVTSALDDKAKSEMISLSIDIADYNVPFHMQSYYKNNNVQSIMYLLYYLNKAPTLNEQLKYVVEFDLSYGTLERKVDYLAMNGLFVHVPEKATEDFRVDFLPSLTSFSADQLPWEKDEKIIEAKADSLFLDMEREILDYSDYVGSRYTDALTLRQECEAALMKNGVTEDEAEKLLEEIDQLSEQSLQEQEEMAKELPDIE